MKQGVDLLLKLWDLPKPAPPELEKAADQLKQSFDDNVVKFIGAFNMQQRV